MRPKSNPHVYAFHGDQGWNLLNDDEPYAAFGRWIDHELAKLEAQFAPLRAAKSTAVAVLNPPDRGVRRRAK